MDEKSNEDLKQLNALVDGELGPSERAALATRLAANPNLARAHATLALLKAAVVDQAHAGPAANFSVKRRRVWWPAGVAAAVAAGLAALWAFLPPTIVDPVQNRERTILTLASLPSGVAMPSLDRAGLQLVDLAVDSRESLPVVTANYRGSHGCRLELRAAPVDLSIAPLFGTSRHAWRVGAISYELVAHGMPARRFSIIAEAAERQTRESSMPPAADLKLREARIGAPPCAG